MKNNLIETIIKSLSPEFLALIPFNLGIGYILKKAKLISNNIIPLILCMLSVSMTVLYNISNHSKFLLYSSITQGVIAWLISWIAYEKVIKPKKIKDNTNEKDKTDIDSNNK